MSGLNQWQEAEKERVHETVFQLVPTLELQQSYVFDRMVRLEALYDPNNPSVTEGGARKFGEVQENVIASNIDTVSAVISSVDVRPRVMTDDADWSTQRTARHLEWYGEALMALFDVHPKARLAFKEASKKGIGLVKVTADRFKRPCVEHVFPDDVIVDELETRYGGGPRQLHHVRRNVPKDQLKAEYPKKAEEIEAISSARAIGTRRRARYVHKENELVVIHSWYLPIGKMGAEGYKSGRETVTVDGLDLYDEKWDKPFFPIARLAWSERAGGWYGISLSERIAGHQLAINKMNWQTDRQLDQLAVPTTYVRPADANIRAQTSSRLGTIAISRGEYPKTIIPQAVSPETYQRLQTLKNSSFEESGVSRMASQSVKPAGIDSGVALREYRDQTTQRFALQEKAYERFILDIVWLLFDVCKTLGADAPVVQRKTRFGTKKIPWSKVDMGDLRINLQAASTLSRTPAGRIQTVIEWAQAGVISQDEARRLMEHPDLERAMSLYNEALENVEHCLEEMADGGIVMPEPFMNLSMCVWRGQMQYLKWQDDGAPEDVISVLRDFVVNAAYIDSQKAANDNAGAAAGMPPMASPANDPAVAAFSPQAMQLKAG